MSGYRPDRQAPKSVAQRARIEQMDENDCFAAWMWLNQKRGYQSVEPEGSYERLLIERMAFLENCRLQSAPTSQVNHWD